MAAFFMIIILLSCSKHIDYSPAHIKETSGRYLYNQDEVIEVYYEQNQLFLKWKGASKIKPVVLDENTFFVPDMYKKLRFVRQPATKKMYLGVVSENDDHQVGYDYPKVANDYKTPWMYLTSGAYDEATMGYLKLKKQDSTKTYIEESEVNRLGYGLLRKKDYKNAVKVFEMNVALYPQSDNVYDSLADAFLRSGDSLQAYLNYKKALELNSGNERAKAYVKQFNPK